MSDQERKVNDNKRKVIYMYMLLDIEECARTMISEGVLNLEI